jgi:hypothetical protein
MGLPVAKNLSNIDDYNHMAKLKKVKKKATKGKATKKATPTSPQQASTTSS